MLADQSAMKPAGSMRTQLIVFIVLAFALAWMGMLPVVMRYGFLKMGGFLFLFGPAIAALITAGWAGGVSGIKEVLGRYFRWKTQAGWYLLALLLMPAIFLIAAAVSFPAHLAELWTKNPWYFVVASFGFLMFITSGEEIGWRGFALPRLERVFGHPFLTGVIVGVVWGLWHAPMYLIPGQSSFPFYLFMPFIVGLSVLYSVLFQNTNGSLLLAVILHASTDITPRIMQIDKFTVTTWAIIAALTWMAALVCTWCFARGDFRQAIRRRRDEKKSS